MVIEPGAAIVEGRGHPCRQSARTRCGGIGCRYKNSVEKVIRTFCPSCQFRQLTQLTKRRIVFTVTDKLIAELDVGTHHLAAKAVERDQLMPGPEKLGPSM